MMRKSKTTYLLEPDSKDNEYKKFDIDTKKFIDAAKISCKKNTGRKMQTSAIKSLIKESVINIKSDTSISDIEQLFKELNKKFGGYEPHEIALHKDEGYFHHIEKDLEYRPNKDIFYNEKTKKFYLDKEFENEADLSQFEKRFNYHAHVIYSPFDMEVGKSKNNKATMVEIQTITAKSLGMERGAEWSKAIRKSHWQLKEIADIKRDAKVLLNSQKDLIGLKDRTIADLRAELKAQGAKRPEYAKLEQLHRDLTSKLKDQNFSLEEMERQLTLITDAMGDKSSEVVQSQKMVAFKDSKIHKLENELIDEREAHNELKVSHDSLKEENGRLGRALDALTSKYHVLIEYASKHIPFWNGSTEEEPLADGLTAIPTKTNTITDKDDDDSLQRPF